MTNRSPADGFTLIEVLVATFIMAVLSTIGVIMLTNTLRAQDHLEAVAEEIQSLELARAVIKDDMSQLSLRRTRNEFGERENRPFVGDGALGRGRLMGFVRNGHRTPGLEVRSSTLQRVEYFVENDALIRRSSAFVDVAEGTAIRDKVLLRDLKNVKATFSDDGKWADFWSPGETRQTAEALPSAVALSFETVRYGDIRLVFLTPRGF